LKLDIAGLRKEKLGKTFLKRKRVERHYETKNKSLKYNKTC